MDVAEITLKIVPVDQIVLHEGQDPLVVKKLGERLKQDRILRNPPIVAEADGRYIVLDGATRTGAFKYLGIKDALVQVVDYAAQNISLDSWHHLIIRMPPSELLARISGVDGVAIERVNQKQAEHDLTMGISMCYLKLRNGATYNVIGVDHLELNIALLNRIVEVYRGRTDVYRAVTTDLDILTREYSDLQMLVVFPRYTPAQVTRLALNGSKLPMGITRHLIGGRAIGINIPIDILLSEDSPAEKNVWLQNWLMEKIHERKVRFYQEPVFVFDE